ncbi:MAG: ASKHA domain-containing protein [Candidatus Electrothrix scaldis]|nr:MAG: ASKHA domain-containing protein [Candidatus Electrothrix sp. GW3-3]
MQKTIPLVSLIHVNAAPPSLQDNTADLDRLKLALAESLPDPLRSCASHIPFSCMAPLAAAFRAADFTGYAVVQYEPTRLVLVDFFAKAPKRLPALALDLGSTHLEATLLDLLTGETIAHAAVLNRQVDYGTDILSRIHFAERKEGERQGLVVLQEAVLASIHELLDELCQEAAVSPQEVQAAAVSGNTTMVHLLLGLNPRHICREPYIPLANAPDPCLAQEIGLQLHPQATVRVLPGKGSYFGGDLMSGILATGLDQGEETCMLIDVGTNAEVVMGNSEWLIACAGAAGPALEGGVARMGMRAAAGAVEHVAIDRENWQLTWRSIGEAPPVGLCGSGLIDLVAELYLARIVDLRGKFQASFPDQSEAQKAFVEERLLEMDGEQVFLAVAAGEAGNDEPVLLSQLDLDAMMRSKAAMYAILVTLTGQVGLEFSDLSRISVAGAFGKHINPRQAITLGMLPDLPLSTFQPVGNSSLRGAELVLLDHKAFEQSLEIARKITYIELNVNQEFMIRFSGSRFIPHTDPGLFPSVPSFR